MKQKWIILTLAAIIVLFTVAYHNTVTGVVDIKTTSEFKTVDAKDYSVENTGSEQDPISDKTNDAPAESPSPSEVLFSEAVPGQRLPSEYLPDKDDIRFKITVNSEALNLDNHTFIVRTDKDFNPKENREDEKAVRDMVIIHLTQRDTDINLSFIKKEFANSEYSIEPYTNDSMFPSVLAGAGEISPRYQTCDGGNYHMSDYDIRNEDVWDARYYYSYEVKTCDFCGYEEWKLKWQQLRPDYL